MLPFWFGSLLIHFISVMVVFPIIGPDRIDFSCPTFTQSCDSVIYLTVNGYFCESFITSTYSDVCIFIFFLSGNGWIRHPSESGVFPIICVRLSFCLWHYKVLKYIGKNQTSRMKISYVCRFSSRKLIGSKTTICLCFMLSSTISNSAN